MKRLYVHSDAVAEGKAFMAFLALIIRSSMSNSLQKFLNDHKFAFRKLLLELDKAKLIISADHISGHRLLNPPSKILRDIFSALGLDPACLTSV